MTDGQDTNSNDIKGGAAPPPPAGTPILYGGSTSAPPPAAPVHFVTNELTPPAVPGGGDGSHAPTAVNTTAMKQFGDNLTSLIAPIDKCLSDLSGVVINGGSFNVAYTLAHKIANPADTSSLVPTVMAALNSIKDALEETSVGVHKMAADFDSTDDLNKVSIADYNRYLGVVPGTVATIAGSSSAAAPAGAPSSPTDPTGGGSTPPPSGGGGTPPPPGGGGNSAPAGGKQTG